MTYMDLCLPCEVRYDYILKMETLDSDSQEALSLFLNKGQRSVTLPHLHAKRPVQERLVSTSNVFRQLDMDLVKAIMKIYQVDFDLFGYTWDEVDGASCSSDVSLLECC